MTEQSGSFPSKEFSLWVREASTAYAIREKLLMAVRSGPPFCVPYYDEVVLLRAIGDQLKGASSSSRMLCGMLEAEGKYPVLSGDLLQEIWKELAAYGARGGRFSGLCGQVDVFLQGHSSDVQTIMAAMWSSFCPELPV